MFDKYFSDGSFSCVGVYVPPFIIDRIKREEDNRRDQGIPYELPVEDWSEYREDKEPTENIEKGRRGYVIIDDTVDTIDSIF